MVTSINDYAPYPPIPIANFVTDAILHDGVIWIGFDRTLSLYEIPVLWRSDNYPDAGQDHVKLAGIDFHKVNVSSAVPVEMGSDIISISVFEVIDGDLWAVGVRRINDRGTYCRVFYRLVDGTFVENGNGPYISTNAGGINKLIKAPKGGIYATSISDGFLYINGSAQDISIGGCIARRGDVLYKASQEVIATDADHLRKSYCRLNYYSYDGITWHQTSQSVTLRANKFYEKAILSFRGVMWGLRQNEVSPGVYTTTLLKIFSNGSWQEIITMSGETRIVLAMGDAVILLDYSRKQAFAVGPEQIEHCGFPWSVKRTHGDNLQACLLCENNSSVTVVLGTIGLSVFNLSLEWGTGDGVNRPQVDGIQVQWKASDETGESPQVNSAGLEWGSGIAPPGESDKILWLVNDDSNRTCYKVRFCTSADETTESQLRCIIRADLETFDIDAWQTYEEFHCNEFYSLERPGHEVRIGIIAPDELVPVDFNLQYIREED